MFKSIKKLVEGYSYLKNAKITSTFQEKLFVQYTILYYLYYIYYLCTVY